MKCSRPKIASFVGSRSGGFTLAEVMVGVAIASILVAVVTGLAIYSTQSFVALANYVELNSRSQLALDHFTRDLRGANAVRSYTNNILTLLDSDVTELKYVYDPTAKSLTRVKGGISTVLLNGCDSFEIACYARNSSADPYDQYATTNAANCDVIQASWKCSRTLLGRAMNTEEIQSAKILIRN